MATSLIRRTVVPAIAAGLLVLAACTQPEAEAQSFGSPGTVSITDPGKLEPETAIASDEDKKPGLLIGPHYSLQLTGSTVSNSVPADRAEHYGFDADQTVKAKKGNEFLLAQLSDESHGDKPAKATLVADGEEVKLERMPTGGEAIAAVVPVDAEVLLSITDEDRTQTLNLRTGERASAIDGYYSAKPHSPDLKDYSESGKATGSAGKKYLAETRSLSISMSLAEAARAPWHEDHGWAADGKVWVTVPISKMTTNSVWGFDAGKDSHEPIMNWTLKEKDLFSLTPADGKAVKPLGEATFTADDSRNPTSESGDLEFDPAAVELVFEIPDDVTSATLNISPSGELKAKWSDVEGSAKWESKPATAKTPVKF